METKQKQELTYYLLFVISLYGITTNILMTKYNTTTFTNKHQIEPGLQKVRHKKPGLESRLAKDVKIWTKK